MLGCSLLRRPYTAGLLTVLLVAAVLGAACPPGAAQVQIDVTHPGGLMRLLMNNPATTVVGADGNGNPLYWNPPGSRFQLRTGVALPRGGDPTRTGDEDRAVVARVGVGKYLTPTYSGRIQISVNNSVADVDGIVFDPYDISNAEDNNTDPAALAPVWAAPTTQTTRGSLGTFVCPVAEGQTVAELPVLQVTQNYQLVGDVLMLEVVVTNTTDASQWVGIRHAFDTWFGSTGVNGWLDGQPLILDDGRVVANESIYPDPAIPSHTRPLSWVAYDDALDPNVSVKGILESDEISQPGSATTSAGPPDVFEVGMANRILNAGFGFVPNSGLALTGEDWAVGVKWNEEELKPGASRRYVTYIGLGASVGNYDTPFATMSYAPTRLQAQVGDDPSTPDIETYYLTDGQGRSPFPVAVYVDNFGGSALSAATASISLPTELSLLPDTQPGTFTLGLIPRNEMLSASWDVSAASARPRQVTVELTGPRGRRVDRDILIPAVPIMIPQVSVDGLEMVSVPYGFVNTDAEHVFESLGGLEPGQPGSLIRWDPVAMTYRWFPHLAVTNVAPGKGYWLLNLGRVPVVLPADAYEVSTLSSYAIELKKGWNQIGTPFTLTTPLATAEVTDSRGARYSIREAADALLLQPVLFSYNPATQGYEYESKLSTTILDPFEGYWILAYRDLTLDLLPPGTLSAASAGASAQLISSPEAGWRLNLAVGGDGVRTSQVTLGVAPGARDDLDAQDIVAPPAAIGSRVQVALVSPGNAAGRVVDLQAPDEQEKTWYVHVTSAAPRTGLALSWPDLSRLPEGWVPILEDTATGARAYMRTTARYRFDVGPESSRLFKIVIRPKSAGAPQVSQVRAEAAEGGNFSIVYTLSAPAAVDVEIRNIAGLVIKRVVTGQVSTAGANTVLWNGRSDRGARVPAGRYLLQFTARSPETGQSSNVVTTFEVTR